ncbi:helix-turn-helix transcriptional regulator [Nocardioides deserti]|uniref:GAF domain-containing protein n=1 Tax=Nocardioides deserti TaxID=1588644 RepID=A0ABR6UAH1_9ACTN|nr:LuxR C-terminal-related transcriptional regulator [Nocardioides deserti]MBC2961441.1 GAF domain-containing protein [Nocardioides deserti]GGO78518.1 helix-turn-helix transcriptional regulator [Nocardioides deserti]
MDPRAEETRLWASALGALRERTGAPMVFGGAVVPGGLRLTHVVGSRTGALQGLLVRPGAGLGGRVWQESDALVVADYGLATDISHDYDEPVRSEGLRTVAGAPVIVDRVLRGVVYAGTRGLPVTGDRLREAAVAAARTLAREIAVEDEVERRLAARRAHDSQAAVALGHAHAEVRALVGRTADPDLRERLDRLAALLVLGPADDLALSPRQVDVLSLVATGASYATVGERLGLSPQTVKSYMRDILVVLGVHSRHEAVAEARRRRLVP